MMALEGIKVLELGRVSPAELPGMLLADMGADVLKIDTPGGAPLSDAAARKAAHAHTNRNKRSIALDLKAAEARAVFAELAATADVIIEGFRPGVTARLGADYETVRASNPRVVYCSLSGFGQSGPYRLRPAHDLNFLAFSGVLALMGRVGGEAPAIPLNLVADYGGASMHGALAIMFALFARERTGVGQYIDISYLDATIALLAATPNWRGVLSGNTIPRRGEGVFSGTYPYYAIYETRDRRLLSVACSEPPLWKNFCEAIGLPELARHARRAEHYDRTADAAEIAAREQVAAVLKTRDLTSWEQQFVALDVCVAPVNEVDEMLRDPQVRHRATLTEVAHPRWGAVRQIDSPLRMSDTPPRLRSAAPLPGEHTRAVLASLGRDAAAIESLLERGIVG
ncbi:MAG: CaiB/BaiF CoA transferase family protein [Janthinobacterium lividum]